MSENRVNTVPKKLLEARAHIKGSNLKREGENSFSHYEYYTPDQVSTLVNQANQEVGLISTFSLEKDEIGYFGRLLTIDVETGYMLESIMRTEIPEIKATNATQKMGGAYTYTKRYMLMNEYDIADNNLDFDSQDNRSSKQKEVDESKPTLSLKKKHISSEQNKEVESKPAIEAARPKEDSKEEEEVKSELESLREKCDELGIKYNGRHKESGLKKLIKEHNESGKSEAFEGGEDADNEEEVEPLNNEDPYSATPSEEEEDVLTLESYIDSVEAYSKAEDLAEQAKSVVADAEGNGLDDDEIEALKEAIKKKYRELKQA